MPHEPLADASTQCYALSQQITGKTDMHSTTFEIASLDEWLVLNAKRWELLKALCGEGPVSIREAARRVGRDVKAVHGDVTALLNAGILQKTEKGQIIFPYDSVRVNFMLHAA